MKNSELATSIKSETRARAFDLAELSFELDDIFTKSPGSLTKNFNRNGDTLFSLLASNELDRDLIIKMATEIEAYKTKLATKGSASEIPSTLLDLTRSS